MNTVIKDTDGLYYPYIHVRDEAWLKATLLYFPHILRMVPPGFETRDSDLVRDLAQKPVREASRCSATTTCAPTLRTKR